MQSVELTRISFVWAVFLAAAAVVGRDQHIRITVLADQLSAGLRLWLTRSLHLMAAGFGAVMVWQGMILVGKMTATVLPALGVSQVWLYGGLPVSGALIVVHALTHVIDPPDPVELQP